MRKTILYPCFITVMVALAPLAAMAQRKITGVVQDSKNSAALKP